MMQNPFFRSHVVPSSFPFEATSRGGYRRDAPIHQRHTSNEFRSSPKVVSIPIHFVESENSTGSVAALQIQKVFRGFLVRKNVKKINTIKREVDEIEKKISMTVDSIREDAKERLKVNEMLMGLLFRLDSVRGIDSGVRDFRRKVIKKAILLQERLDAIVAGDQTLVEEEVSEEHLEEDAVVDDDGNYQTMEIDIGKQSEIKVSGCNSAEDMLNSLDESDEKGEGVADEEGLALADAEEEEEEVNKPLEVEKNDQSSIEEEEEGYLIVKNEEDDGGAMEVQQSDLVVEDREESRDENKELMERMIERNDMLIGLVRELCEKNKMQTQMITCLSKRVDNLEKALKIERSKCKKRK